MPQICVKLNTVEQVREFVKIVDRFDVNFDLGLGKKVVDAKSLIGVFSLDLTKPQILQFDSEDEKIFEMLAPFQVKEK